MLQLRFTRLAESDLDGILDFIAESAPVTAQQFVAGLRERCSLIATQPEIGRLHSELPGALRSFPFGNYLVMYRVHEDAVQIIRVLHGARDLEVLLK